MKDSKSSDDLLRSARKRPRERDAKDLVDFDQFRNTVVGSGYQAKHVVRQRSVAPLRTKIKVVNDVVYQEKEAVKPSSSVTKEDFLRNEGLRAFRKELESLLS